ncbi:MAG: pyridoxamine 5'-phosphate oxidase family protein [Burkholderiales bacterium]|nr:MAG: pyridoxamine 5'-phosphate oxidase family protein [Burkholderiales bacterium]
MPIDTLDALRALYPPAKERSLRKQLAALDAHCRRFVAMSPFVVLASRGPDGTMDASPRGGEPGFVLAPDEHTLLLPDASGNNRLDTLENIVATGSLGLLFMLPGVDETLRVNGTARLSIDAARLALFPRSPRLVIEVRVQEAYLHCAKALMRSKLWDAGRHVPRSVLPTMGEMLKDQIGDEAPAETQAQMLARYAQDL